MKLLFAAALLFFSCTQQVLVQPLKYDFMPRPILFDSLLSDIPTPKTSGLDDYSVIAINNGTGTVCTDTSCKAVKKIDLPAGNLFSDKKAVEYANYQITVPATNKRLAINRELLKVYQLNLYKADSLYNDRLIYLEKQNQRTWLESNMGYIGFLCGVIFAVIVESVSVRAIR